MAGFSRWPDQAGWSVMALRVRAGRWLGVSVASLAVLVIAGGMTATPARLLAHAASVVVGVALMLVAAHQWRHPLRPWNAVAMVACSTTLWALPDVTRAASGTVGATTDPTALHVPAYFALTLAAVTCVLAVSRAAAVLGVLICAAGGLFVARLAGEAPYPQVVDTVVLSIGIAFAALAWIETAGRTADEADQAAQLASETESDNEAAAARLANEEEVRRLLHDEVLAALRAVSDLPLEREDNVRQACRRAAESLRAMEAR